jgi:hypothetical protein
LPKGQSSNRRAIHLDFCLRASYDFPLVGRNKIKMKKLSTGILFLFLVISVKVQGMTFSSTLNTNSTEGNYYGTMDFSFSTSDYWYGHYYSDQSFTDPASGVQIGIESVGGLADGPDDVELLIEISLNDPYIGVVQSQLSGYGQGSTFFGYDLGSGGVLYLGQPTAIGYAGGGSDSYYSWSLNATGTVSFGYSMTGYFDGTSGSATGSWFFDYSAPQIVSAPEPAVTLQLALGGCCLWLARARQRRRN